MRPVPRRLLAAILLFFPLTLALADARADLRIKTKETEDRYKVFTLANDGETPIKATVELTKKCSGVSNGEKSKKTEYWIQADSEIELGRAWSQSTCKRDYRVVAAEYIRS